jgi:hypothetical protein
MANGYFSFQRSPLQPPAPGSLFSLCINSSANSTKLWFNLHRSADNASYVQIMPDVHVPSAVSVCPGRRDLVPGLFLVNTELGFPISITRSPDHQIPRSWPSSASPCLRGGCPVLPFRSRRCRAMSALSAIPILPSVIPSGA